MTSPEPGFADQMALTCLAHLEQEEAMFAWYLGHLEWLANGGLMRRRANPVSG